MQKTIAIRRTKFIWLQRKRKLLRKRLLRSADNSISATTRRSILSKEKSFVLGGGFFFSFFLYRACLPTGRQKSLFYDKIA